MDTLTAMDEIIKKIMDLEKRVEELEMDQRYREDFEREQRERE